MTLNGYNIYRDGIRLNTEPVAETAFTDSDIADNKLHNYTLTGKARTAIPLAQGFYIVKAGTAAAKIIVK